MTMKRSQVDSDDDEMVEMDHCKRVKDTHQDTFPILNDNNRLGTFIGYHFQCQETDIITSPGFVLIHVGDFAYVLPLSTLLNPANNTKQTIPCAMVDYNEVEIEKHHGYFRNEGQIKCHPLEAELMQRTQKNIKEYLDGRLVGPSGFVATVIVNEEYPDHVLVFSVLIWGTVHTFYVPLCMFVDQGHWPTLYKGCHLPF